MLPLEDQLSAERSPRVVVEIAELRTIDNGLHVASVVVVEKIEYGNACAHLELPLAPVDGERPGHLHIGGRELCVPLRVARSQILSIVILYRPGEACMSIEHRRDGQFPRSLDVSPDKESIRRVERKPPT